MSEPVRETDDNLVFVSEVDELDDGERVHVDAKGEEITVFNLDGEYRALLNYCPHQKGPLCDGPVSGTLTAALEDNEVKLSYDRVNRVVACPWHGWEFDITTGELLAKKDVTVPRYDVITQDNKIYVDIASATW